MPASVQQAWPGEAPLPPSPNRFLGPRRYHFASAGARHDLRMRPPGELRKLRSLDPRGSSQVCPQQSSSRLVSRLVQVHRRMRGSQDRGRGMTGGTTRTRSDEQYQLTRRPSAAAADLASISRGSGKVQGAAWVCLGQIMTNRAGPFGRPTLSWPAQRRLWRWIAVELARRHLDGLVCRSNPQPGAGERIERVVFGRNESRQLSKGLA